ncbi:MAG: DUF3006 domain-containing protein [Oscillospiraceae bacterium]|jgi:hypothetical protein|nr:DUF3006 domain-containing protein [Oscillospiraceae bacterium]
MRKLYIDRFEGQFAVCEEDGEARFGIPTEELPAGAKEGDCLLISGEGVITIDKKETELRRKNNAKKQKKVF